MADDQSPRMDRLKSMIGRIPYLRHFRLRTLFAFFLIVVVLAGYVSGPVYTRLQHARLATQLRGVGCYVDFDFEKGLVQTGTRPPTPSLWIWLHRKLPLGKIERVMIPEKANPQQVAEAVTILSQIGSLDQFCSYSAPLDVSHLETLLSNVNVRSLYVHQAKLPRGRIPCLSYRPISWIYLGRSQFSDPAIDDLPISLVYCDATRTRITDQGLASFVRLKNLKTLKLIRTQTTPAGIQKLKQQMPWCKIEWEPLKPK